MDPARIRALLVPFLPEPALSPALLRSTSIYLDLLLRWNQKINLTSVRDPEQMITRHFGESFFAADRLLCGGPAERVFDLGSGAGFPGLPLKIYAPAAHVTLIESHQRKAVFLKEVIRALTLTNIDVFAGRAEDLRKGSAAGLADLVTVRAVEHFESTLELAAGLVRPGGRLAYLLGPAQAAGARKLLPSFTWPPPVPIPGSGGRVLLVGQSPA